MKAQLTGQVRSDGDLAAWIERGGLRGCHAVIAWNSGLTDRGACAIATAADASSLEYVDVSWNLIAGSGAASLVASRGLARMTRLRLYHNDVGVDGAASIARDGARLAMLNLCGNALGDAGVAVLAAGGLGGLRELALGWNALGSEAVRAVVSGPWRRLEMLNIRANRLGPADVGALVSGALPALRWLGVDENPVGDAGLAALLAGPGFARLEWLNLGGTQLDERAVARFAAIGPCALRELRVHDNDLSPAGVARLRAALPHCEVRA